MCILAVPEVGFKRGVFSTDLTEDGASVRVCLHYNNTGGGYATFNINVALSSQGYVTYCNKLVGSVKQSIGIHLHDL